LSLISSAIEENSTNVAKLVYMTPFLNCLIHSSNSIPLYNFG